MLYIVCLLLTQMTDSILIRNTSRFSFLNQRDKLLRIFAFNRYDYRTDKGAQTRDVGTTWGQGNPKKLFVCQEAQMIKEYQSRAPQTLWFMTNNVVVIILLIHISDIWIVHRPCRSSSSMYCGWLAPENRLLMSLSSGGHLGELGAMTAPHWITGFQSKQCVPKNSETCLLWTDWIKQAKEQTSRLIFQLCC